MSPRAFLVIGAMKAGTTSLFHDLSRHPAICMPEKEPAYLVRYTAPEAAEAYRKLFLGAQPGQIVGEASTGYSMGPRFTGVAEKARACLGPDLRILYLLRNPIHRALSHHYHAMTYNEAEGNPDIAMKQNPDFLAVSCYATQLEPWRSAFPPAQIRVVIAEEYYAAVQVTMSQLYAFLGVPDSRQATPSIWHNRGEQRRVGRWDVVRRSKWYRRHVAPRVSAAIRNQLARILLSPGPPRPNPPSPDCLRRMADALAPDVEALTRFMGRSSPPWDLGETVRALTEKARTEVRSARFNL